MGERLTFSRRRTRRDILGKQDQPGLPGKGDRIDGKNALYLAAVGALEETLKTTRPSCLAALLLYIGPDQRVLIAPRQEFHQLKEVQLGGGVASHVQKGRIGIAAAAINNQERAFGGRLRQGMVSFG